MRVLVQRSKNACVKVNNKIIGSIDNGLVLLVCFCDTDNESTIDDMIKKVLNLRIFDDENGIMNRSVLDVKGKVLSISQFTLYADTKKGNRPSYRKALSGDKAVLLYNMFNEKLKEYVKTETGEFGSNMDISFTNHGPVTILLEKE